MAALISNAVIVGWDHDSSYCYSSCLRMGRCIPSITAHHSQGDICLSVGDLQNLHEIPFSYCIPVNSDVCFVKMHFPLIEIAQHTVCVSRISNPSGRLSLSQSTGCQ